MKYDQDRSKYNELRFLKNIIFRGISVYGHWVQQSKSNVCIKWCDSSKYKRFWFCHLYQYNVHFFHETASIGHNLPKLVYACSGIATYVAIPGLGQLRLGLQANLAYPAPSLPVWNRLVFEPFFIIFFLLFFIIFLDHF